MEFKDDKQFNVLCLSSGGLKGLGQLGALALLHEKGVLKHIDKYIGTSIGAVNGALLCAGFTPSNLMKELARMNIFGNVKSDLLNFFQNYGLVDISSFATNIEILFRKKLDRSPTFKQLYDLTHKILVVVTVNHTTGKVEYLSYLTHPNLMVVNGLKMSCNIPYLFKKIRYQGCYYVDGALLDPFPLTYFDDGTNLIVGVVTNGFKMMMNQDSDEHDDFFNYFYQTLLIPVN